MALSRASLRRLSAPPSIRATIRVPGDKSVSHRAALLGALAQGPSVIENFLPAADCRATLACLEALGVRCTLTEGDISLLRVEGGGLASLHEPAGVLDAANSGTTARLLAGALAGQPFFSVLTGDESLRSRPMERVVEPLRRMGAQLWGREGDTRLPLAIRGSVLHGVTYSSPVASAQVKSSVLLAALFAEGETVVTEPAPSRDHTERMLAALGVEVRSEGCSVRLKPPRGALEPLKMRVPGDISAAAFWLVAGAAHPDAEVYLPAVGVNPTRDGVLEVLAAMGADLDVTPREAQGGEPVADLRVRSSRLRAVEIGGALVPRCIDELPVLALAATQAEGETVIRDAAELRVKESDRIAATAEGLRTLGAEVEELPDGLRVRGPTPLRGGRCSARGDHRMAMTLAVAGLLSRDEVVVEGAESVAISYPGFWPEVAGLLRAGSGGRSRPREGGSRWR